MDRHSDDLGQGEPHDRRSGWLPRQVAGFLPKFEARYGAYGTGAWVYMGRQWMAMPIEEAAGKMWKEDRSYGGFLYRLTGNAEYVTRLGLSVESVGRRETIGIEAFHGYAARLARYATGVAFPKVMSKHILDQEREEDYFKMPLVRHEGSGYAFSFNTSRRDPREPGYRAYYFDVFSPNLAAKAQDDINFLSSNFF